jgi:hypothetical protein
MSGRNTPSGPRPWGVGGWGTSQYSTWPQAADVWEVNGRSQITFAATASGFARTLDCAATSSIHWDLAGHLGRDHYPMARSSIVWQTHGFVGLDVYPQATSGIAFAVVGGALLTWEDYAPCEPGVWAPADLCEQGAWASAPDGGAGTWTPADLCEQGAWTSAPNGGAGTWAPARLA